MGYTLAPRRRAAGALDFGAFSWPWLLDQGVGWPLGYYAGLAAGQYLWTGDPAAHRGLPISCDGYRVTAAQAKVMAKLAAYVVAREQAYRQYWEQELTAAERAHRVAWNDKFPLERLYRMPVRQDFVEKAAAFAAWAPQTGGFRIW